MLEKIEYIHCDTIFYQGANCTQTQVMHYTGNQTIQATTGEMMSCTGRNKLKPLNVIFNLHMGPEIAEVNLRPYANYYDYFNPLKGIYTTISWSKNYFSGITIQPANQPTTESVAYHSPILEQMSYGQLSDIESHHKKYLSWKENKKNANLILYGVSRGTAATFCALATYHYPEVKLVILEGAIDSMENIIKNHARQWLGYDTLANWTVKGLQSTVSFISQKGLFGYKRNGESPLDLIEKFPERVPVVFITSKKDRVVFPENTINIATLLSHRGKNDVYLLQLNNSSHPCYMYDDKQDHDQYEAFIHAIYRRYGLAHDAELAQKGEPFLGRCCLTKANFNLMKATCSLFKEKDSIYKNEIIAHLKTLKIRQESIDKILKAVDTMPGRTHVLGALAFLTELTDKQSVCEQYYLHSDYIAEYFCTLTNIGFFAVAFYYQDYATLGVATLSALSHAIPLKRLNELDKTAAICMFIKVISSYQLLATNPDITTAGLLTFTLGALDKGLGRKHIDSWGPVFHSAWHLAAAFALYKFNQAQSSVSPDELTALAQAALSSTIPTYLQQYYMMITESIAGFSKTLLFAP